MLEASFRAKRPDSYTAIVKAVVETLSDPTDEWDSKFPDPERIYVIDDGHYQGNRLFIIGAKGYQPSSYWAVIVDYGSCSGCDTLEALQGYSDDPVTDDELNGTMTLALHILQSMKLITECEAEDE